MFKKLFYIFVMLAASTTATATAPSQASPVHKELAARVIKLQHAAIENMARTLTEQPVIQLLTVTRKALPTRVTPDKRDAVAREIQADAKKYLDETLPVVRERAMKLAPTTLGPILEEKFSEEELRQIIAVLENPAWVKFQKSGADMQKVLLESLLADVRPVIQPKLKALEQSIAQRLGVVEPTGKPAGK